MYEKLSYTNSDELCEQMAKECDTCIMSFSIGKDSIGSWLQVRKYFKHIVPFYNWFLPDGELWEDNLKYYEDFFGQKIYRMPSPSLYRFLRDGTFQPHERWVAICQLLDDMPDEDYDTTQEMEILRYIGNMPEYAYCAVGNRAADNPMRMMNIRKSGAVNHNKKTFYPIYDWKQERLLNEIDAAGIKLPTDYNLWANSFDGMEYMYIAPLKEHCPKDYEKLIHAFPMAQLEFMRREQ